jgi:hypothetical protein
MFKRILVRIREKIRHGQFVVTLHARKEMNDDGLFVFVLVHAILSGEIYERQLDRRTSEFKYRIAGNSLEGEAVEIIVKISMTGSIVILTVYRT